jgi:hypothetical protein
MRVAARSMQQERVMSLIETSLGSCSLRQVDHVAVQRKQLRTLKQRAEARG